MSACRYDRDADEYLTPDGDPCPTCAGLAERLAALSQQGQPWECWPWTSTLNSNGYGVLSIHDRQYRAHRVSYDVERGSIPVGIDHLCRNRACINPDHMEPVPNGENIRRGVSPWAINARRTICKNGHPFSPENTRYDRGKRYCLECKRTTTRISARKRRARLRGDVA